jgi:hypothetical protein
MDVLADKNVRDRLEGLGLWAHYPGRHSRFSISSVDWPSQTALPAIFVRSI